MNSEATTLALQRLHASRGQLTAALQPGANTPSPMLGMAWVALRAWWQQQPFATAVRLLAGELSAQAAPLLRRHPLAVVAAAALLGSVFVAVRPWRLLRVQLGRWVLAQATSAPVLGTLAAMLATLVRSTAAQASAAAPPAEGPAPP